MTSSNERFDVEPNITKYSSIETGIKVEMEHTKDKKRAKKIAQDHLKEDKDYYKDWVDKEKILFQPKAPEIDKAIKEIAAVGVIKDGKILMGKRNDSGKWTQPGGHMENGEKPIDGARRELKEESDIEETDTSKLKKLKTQVVESEKGEKLKIHAFTIELKEDKQKPNPKNDPDEEVDKWQWFNMKKMPKMVISNLHSKNNVVLRELGIIKSKYELTINSDDLIKAARSHKYIRKFQRGGEWVYIYHESENKHREIPEAAVERLKELAQMGDPQAKALYNSLQEHAPGKLKLLQDLADLGDESAKKHLQSMGVSGEAPEKENPRSNVVQLKDYANARDSKFSNIGEDVMGSARHKRAMTIKELREGTTDVKLKDLMEASPVNLIDDVSKENPINSYVCQQMIERFPSMLKQNMGEQGKKDRQVYIDAFEKVRAMAQEYSKPKYAGEGYDTIMKAVKNEVVKILRNARESHTSDANFLIRYVNSTLHPVPSRGNVAQDLYDYRMAVKDSGKQFADFLVSDEGVKATKDLVEGTDLKKVFNIKAQGSSVKKFSMADYYMSKPERKGPETPLHTTKSQTNFLMEDCKMRGLQWGNSVTDKEREHHLKCASEALSDLAEITALPDKLVSYNGRLALAIGARGTGNAMAHYEAKEVVINLTRAKGVGSLSHEWGHFLDNILGQLHGMGGEKSRVFLSEANSGGSSEVKKAIDEITQSKEWADFRKSTIEAHREFTQKGFSMGELGYWISTREMFARSFETYIDEKLVKAGRKNTYLSGGNRGVMWPTQEQIEKMVPLFDNFLAKLRESDFINKALLMVENQ